MKLIDIRPPRIALTLTFIAAASHQIPNIWEDLRFTWLWGGIFLVLAGFSIMMWGWGLFKKNDVPICPKAETTRLISNGVYRFTRNPMYLGMVLMLSGIALGMGTLPFYLSSLVFFILINNVFIPYEERKLTETFGREYREYMKRVRRWI